MPDDMLGAGKPDPRWGAHVACPAEIAPPNPFDGIPPLDYPGLEKPLRKKRRWGRIVVRTLAVIFVLFVLLVGWLAVTAPQGWPPERVAKLKQYLIQRSGR